MIGWTIVGYTRMARWRMEPQVLHKNLLRILEVAEGKIIDIGLEIDEYRGEYNPPSRIW